MTLFPASTNDRYPGSRAACRSLAFAAVFLVLALRPVMPAVPGSVRA